MEKNKRPLFELMIDPLLGLEVDTISIVADPAVESNFLVFSNSNNKQTFNKDKSEILGVAMMANKKILRVNPETGEEYDVFFSAETIRLIAQDFFHKGYNHNVSIEHDGLLVDAHIFQSYLVDEEKGITAPEGITATHGSWIVGMKIDNSKIYENCKSSILNGFSIEGYFLDKLIESKTNPDLFTTSLSLLNDDLDEFINKYNIK